MLAYIVRRLLLVPLTLLCIMVTNFVIIQAAPGGPVEQMIARITGTAVEATARDEGFAVLNLDLRETQAAAIALYEALGYTRWATQPYYARVDDAWVAGHFYSKLLSDDGDGA